ncbi:MAG TPA: hypothetical protein VFS39_02585 [Nitrospira sp.]|nr:hypothetical protein [Nitrospira sp.]
MVTTDGRTLATTAGTDRDFSCGVNDPAPGSASVHGGERSIPNEPTKKTDAIAGLNETLVFIELALWHKSPNQ